MVEWHSVNRIRKEFKLQYREAKELIELINEERKRKGHYIPRTDRESLESLIQKLGLKQNKKRLIPQKEAFSSISTPAIIKNNASNRAFFCLYIR